MTDELPQKIGGYRVIAKLGQGGMARVVLALKPGPAGFRKLMVIKQLREEIASDPEFLTMFLDEARLAARLDHPNVVHTYEVGEDDDTYFIAMDYLEGQPLNRVLHRVRRKNIPTPIHLRIIADALDGLHYAHELQDFDGSPLSVVHRDVSPQNLFITYEGEVKLVDFGIAKAAGASALTKEGVFKGKISYIAPEQARAEKVDRRADIFSVGVMLWEGLAGRRLAKGQDDLVKLHHRLSDTEPDILDVAPDTPEELVAIVRKAMAHEREDRYSTAAEFRDDVEAYLDSIGERVTKKDLAAMLAAHFASERDDLKVKIDEQIQLLENAKSGSLPVLDVALPPSSRAEETPPSTTEPTSKTAISGPASQRESSLGGAAATTSVQTPAKAIPRYLWPLAVIAIAAVIWLVSTRDEPSGPTPPEPEVAATATSTAAPAEDDREITLVVRATPAEATISLDGHGVGANPFRAQLERDPTLHRLRISADGYVTDERMVSFDRDREIAIDLRPAEADEGDPPKPTTVGTRPRPRRRPKTTDKATEPAPKTPPSPTAGMDLSRPKPKPERNIDEMDPYK